MSTSRLGGAAPASRQTEQANCPVVADGQSLRADKGIEPGDTRDTVLMHFHRRQFSGGRVAAEHNYIAAASHPLAADDVEVGTVGTHNMGTVRGKCHPRVGNTQVGIGLARHVEERARNYNVRRGAEGPCLGCD